MLVEQDRFRASARPGGAFPIREAAGTKEDCLPAAHSGAVAIVGAAPTGLILAAELALAGVRCVVLARRPGPRGSKIRFGILDSDFPYMLDGITAGLADGWQQPAEYVS